MLTKDQEDALAERVRAGDPRAREAMIELNMPLVTAIARGYPKPPSISLKDLIGEGHLGLIKAVEEYDHRLGVRFGPYARLWIIASIRAACVRCSPTLRVPRWEQRLIRDFRREAQRIRQEGWGEPGMAEVATRLKWPIRRARRIRRLMESQNPLSIESHKVSPIFKVEDVGEEIEDLAAKFDRLDEREKKVLILRFGIGGRDPLTLKQVGESLGCTGETIRKIEAKAKEKLAAMYK